MPKVCYLEKNFGKGSLKIISDANSIIDEYNELGFDLTLRQLYYQFVSRNLIANKQTEYKRLGSIINDARLAGMIDWYSITDRTRNIRGNSHWSCPEDIVGSAAMGYSIDKRYGQDTYIEVWIEKDALVGVISGVCSRRDVSYFSCRGYTSQSEMWSAAQRLDMKKCVDRVILHFGDHDPSGIDMTRDISDRLNMFADNLVNVIRVALNMNQIEKYNMPPNPVKLTDSRVNGYVRKHGTNESWELDALDPQDMESLVDSYLDRFTDEDKYREMVNIEDKHKEELRLISNNFKDMIDIARRIYQ